MSKFLRPKPFGGGAIDQIVKFLRVDLAKILSDLVEGLRHLRFEDNFDHFLCDVTVPAGGTVIVPNQLRSRTVKWWPVRITGDSRLIQTEITEEIVAIYNRSLSDTTATLLFVR